MDERSHRILAAAGRSVARGNYRDGLADGVSMTLHLLIGVGGAAEEQFNDSYPAATGGELPDELRVWANDALERAHDLKTELGRL